LRERWAAPIEFELGKAQVLVTICDAERFINLSQVVNDKGEQNPVVVAQLRRLVKVLHHTPDIADRIIDYIDADSKGEFESRAKNERLYNVEELLRIDGIAPEVVYGGIISGEPRKGLRDFVTIWPRTTGDATTAGLVNLNTASSEVLQSLSDLMPEPMAAAIVAYRTQPGPDGRAPQFEKVEDLKRVQGLGDDLFSDLNGKVTVKSSTFEIRCRGTVGKVEKTWVYVVQRSAGGAAPAPGTGTPPPATPPPPSGDPATGATSPTPPAITLIGSQMLNDFASVQPPATEK
ncbi:MAG TPA: helix-hairpin-helix domain-containing protein, partial [Planctomycetota bacterium]|nr:helix-hairpin-helix domain-containing protein [Planctomycetota bacterium]